MRYEPEHKTQTRERIVRNAARKIRAEGLSGPGVASVMKASGLTVGGFYKHFRSKDALVAEAIAEAFEESSQKVCAGLDKVAPEDRWREIVRQYLSTEHCDDAGAGCPVAALAPEIARASPGVRKTTAGLLQGHRWVEFMPGATERQRRRKLLHHVQHDGGGMSLARVLTEPADRQQLLTSVRDHLLHSF